MQAPNLVQSKTTQSRGQLLISFGFEVYLTPLPAFFSPLMPRCNVQVVFLGLETLLPLMSLELLKFPKLSCLYFQLLAHMLEVSTRAAPWQPLTHASLLSFAEVPAHP